MTEPVEYVNMDQREHMIYARERDLGDCSIRKVDRWSLDLNSMKFEYVCFPYSTAVERLYLEILYNAADNVERSRNAGINPGSIWVTMKKDNITIKNEGIPITTGFYYNKKEKAMTNIRIPEFIFGTLLTGSNFKQDENRKVGGKFGIGAKATNVFSNIFIVEIGNKNEGVKYTQKWTNNMGNKTEPIIEKYDGTSYTKITFYPDFSRFYDDDDSYDFKGKRQFTLGMIGTFAKYCADVSCTSNVKVSFNGTWIDCTSDEDPSSGMLKYFSMYQKFDNYILYESKDSKCLIVDSPSNGNTISFVNGVFNESGGKHVETWRKKMFKPIREKLKKYKVKDTDIAEHLSMLLICRLPNPKYDGQTKDKLTSPIPEVIFMTQSGEVHPSEILKWDGITELIKILKSRTAALSRKTDGKKVKHTNVIKLEDASEAGGSNSLQCTLYITEGDSAAAFATKGIADGKYGGVLPIKGKLLNVAKCEDDQYNNNDEIKSLKEAIGLVEGTDYSTNEAMNTLRYGSVVILSDQDVDGAHIRGLILNFFRVKFPSLLKRGYIKIMETPYIRVSNKGSTIPFFYEKEYQDWVNKNDSEKTIKLSLPKTYYKGLGSSTDAELEEAMEMGKTTIYKCDEKFDQLMSIAFDEDNEDQRKDWLLSWDDDKLEGKYSSIFPSDTISHFVTNQLCEYASKNTRRTVPSVVDGLKECQRKVITVALSMSKPKMVLQLVGAIIDQMKYKHGDQSLYRTIVGLGNYCVGTNNIPLLKASGQFDSRKGKTAASARYISAGPSHILKSIFRDEDNIILKYQNEGGQQIEPLHYYPIIPIFIINGTIGIGTGFSTKISAHDPIDVMKYIIWWLKKKTNKESISVESLDYPEVKPYYRNYNGRIEKMGKDWYSIGSFEYVKSKKRNKDIIITEIPITQTIESYKEKLNTMKVKPIDPNWKGDSKCPTWIKSYKSSPKNHKYEYKGEKYTEIIPHIEVVDPLCIYSLQQEPLRVLGLIEKISNSNVVLLNEKGIPTQYDHSIYCAMNEYCEIRYNAYVHRRKAKMEEWYKEIQYLEKKKLFIRDVLDSKISFKYPDTKDTTGKVIKGKSKPKSVLEKEIEPMGYPPEFLKISMLSLTEDGIQKIDSEISKFQKKYDDYKTTSPAKLWYRELEELFNKL